MTPEIYKPETTWQKAYTKENGERWIRVHINGKDSAVYFDGPVEEYDGTAVEVFGTPAPTSSWLEKYKGQERAHFIQNPKFYHYLYNEGLKGLCPHLFV